MTMPFYIDSGVLIPGVGVQNKETQFFLLREGNMSIKFVFLLVALATTVHALSDEVSLQSSATPLPLSG